MKTYFNDAVIGNSRVLGCITRDGELVRLFWPNIDYPQHIESFQIGIYAPGSENSTRWLQGSEWEHYQRYIADTNILETIYTSRELGFEISCKDFVTIKSDTLVRHLQFKNISGYEKDINVLAFSNFISSTADLRSTLFDFESDCLIHYRHDYYIAVAGSKVVSDYQITNNPYHAAMRGEFYGIDDVGMVGEGVQAWELGKFQPDEKKSFTLYICCSKTLKKVKDETRKIKDQDVHFLLKDTKQYWMDHLEKGKRRPSGSSDLDELYRRSLLVFKLMSDEVSGGLLAAPEIDEQFTKCGRYAYCWGRDAAFITSALDQAGYPEQVEQFYQWAVRTQAEDGSWYQRYHMDGNLAPSWGIQIDETGTLLWGMLQHYYMVKDRSFLEYIWSSLKKGADFLISFIDKDTGLPRSTYDLWEERIGQHTYSCAAVYAGLKASVEIGKLLEKDDFQWSQWEEAAINMKKSMENLLWDPVQNRFYRAINSTVEGWGFEGHGGKKEIMLNLKGYKRWVSALDIMVDISLLGITIPFEVFDFQDSRILSTVEAIEHCLASPGVGGIRRYETDGYMGGNPWILTTLWLALYHIKIGNDEKAVESLQWAAKHKTYLGLLPEQVDKNTGEAAWIVPLTWSHAMYVLVYLELADRGKI
ncbi:MAG: glycoside hydrolase family 15 protein [Clostridia bacterium]